MSGETNLDRLIASMQPDLHQGEYVFCSVTSLPDGILPLCLFQEPEGLTLILPKHQADELALSYSFISAWITLTIHSSLDAVGFTAAISQALTKANISCNVVAAYYHDHLFVPFQERERAVAILRQLAKEAAL